MRISDENVYICLSIIKRHPRKYLAVHSPNTPVKNRLEKPVFVPICEDNGTLEIKEMIHFLL